MCSIAHCRRLYGSGLNDSGTKLHCSIRESQILCLDAQKYPLALIVERIILHILQAEAEAYREMIICYTVSRESDSPFTEVRLSNRTSEIYCQTSEIMVELRSGLFHKTKS
jgi:hypothetical protein